MMKLTHFDFVDAAGVRRAVVPAGDIRGDIGFQNDINVLLARLDSPNPGLLALGLVREPANVAPLRAIRRRLAQHALRLVDGAAGKKVKPAEILHRRAVGVSTRG